MIVNEAVCDFSSDKQKKNFAKTLVDIGKKQIDNVIQLLSNDKVSSESQDYGFDVKIPGLYGMPGVYVIVNTETKKLYIGGSSNLSNRRSTYKFNMLKPLSGSPRSRKDKLSKLIREDLNQGKIDDFCFIPIIGIQKANLSGFEVSPSQSVQIQRFIDLEVEQALLDFYLNSANQTSVSFYNVKTVGAFNIGNTFGGAPYSGSPDRPLTYGKYAWQSVSAAATSLKKDRKAIRERLKKGQFRNLTVEEYDNFQGKKISNQDASTYFTGAREAELKALLSQLKFRNQKNPKYD